MDWILASLLMFVSSVMLYLFIRKCTLLKINRQLTNLAIFAIPLLAFLIMAVISGENLGITFYQLAVVFVAALLFSYLGNVFSLKSIEAAPNPGYSVIISKSYVVFTAIMSVFLFGSPLGLRSVISIIMIIGFSALIVIDSKSPKNVRKSNTWLWLSLGAFLCWGMLALVSRYQLEIGLGTLSRLIYLHLFVSFFIMGEIGIKKISFRKLEKNSWLYLVFTGLFSAGFGYFMQLGYNLSPNVGYISAVNTSSIGVLTIMSALIFGDELNLRKMIGILGVTAGMILLLF